MKKATDLVTSVESEPTLGSDWVDAHADYLFNFAIGQVRDAHTAEDLVQETFLAASPLRGPGWWEFCVTRFTTICGRPAASAPCATTRGPQTTRNPGKNPRCGSMMWPRKRNCPATASSWTNFGPIWNWRLASCPRASLRCSNFTRSKNARTATCASN